MVQPGGAPANPGGVPVHPGGVPVIAGAATVFVGFEIATWVNRDGTAVNRGEPGRRRGGTRLTMAKFLKLVHSGGVPVHPGAVPVISVPSRLPTDCAGSSRFITVESLIYYVVPVLLGF